MEFQGVVTEGKERGFRERDAEQNRVEVLRDEYYTKNFNADSVYLVSADEVNVSGIPTIRFGQGSNEIARDSFLKPQYWRNGLVRVDVYWSTDDVSTADIQLDIVVYGHKINATATGGRTTIYSGTPALTLTPTGTAYYMQKDSVTSSVALTNEMKIISMLFERDAASDTNSDNFLIHAIELTFLPEYRQ